MRVYSYATFEYGNENLEVTPYLQRQGDIRWAKASYKGTRGGGQCPRLYSMLLVAKS